MSTRSSARILVPPLEDPERSIRRTRVNPNPFEEINMAATGAGNDGPPPAGGDGFTTTNFGLKNDMIQQVQNSCPFRGPGDDANKHLDKFLHVTQSMKVNGVSDDALRLYLVPYSFETSLTMRHRDTINAAASGTFMKRQPEECYDLIENMTAHHNDWDT
ncbi:hypothetical protein Tco_1504068 [Tanacetum coccineum]